VQRYELLGRREGGGKWFSIGRFRGNIDSTTEVGHSLSTLAEPGMDGLALRYLRFRPLGKADGGYNTWKAMRVCVFGKQVGEVGGAQGVARLDSRKQRGKKGRK
jgi:hypothetical protein